MTGFTQFLAESKQSKDFSEHKPVVIAPGRFNPPHRGHKLVIDKLIALGENLDAEPVVLIIDSGKYGPNNPLSGDVRKTYLQKMFPDMRFETFQNAYEAVAKLAEEHNLIPIGGVAGADRGDSYRGMVGSIFGESIKERYHSEVLHRDPDATNITGVSGTRVRQAASEGDIVAIRAMTGLGDEDARGLLKLLVDGMNTNGK